MKVKRVFLAIMLLAVVVDVVPSLVLMSVPSLSEPYCPGPVLFICNTTDIAPALSWELNDNSIGEYTFDTMDIYPLDLTVTSPLIDSIQVISATLNGNSVDIASTLRVSDVSLLNGSSIHCEDFLQRDSNRANISVASTASPPGPAPNCSLLPPSGGPEVILQWSDMFNCDHAVDKYRVSMSPSLPSCPNTLEVGPDQDYTCSGLEIGQQYNISFTAFNCQQGETATYSFQLEAPGAPIGVSLVTIDSLQWMEMTTPSFSADCTFDSTVSYLVIVQDNSGETIANKTVLSESCENGVCFTSIPSSDRNCRVTVRVSNVFGESDNADFAIIGSSKYTSTNIVLMVIGLIVWFLALCICVVTLIVIIKGTSQALVLCIDVPLLVVSLCVWVAAGAYVEQEEDTCDPMWQSNRNGLIISAHVISDIAFLVVSLLFCLCISVRQNCKISSMDKQSLKMEPVNVKTDHSTNRQGTVTAEDDVQLIRESGDTLDHAKHEVCWLEDDAFVEPGETRETHAAKVLIAQEEEHQTRHVKSCHSMKVYNEQLQGRGESNPQKVAAWLTDDRKWPQEDLPLKVYFMSDCPKEWKYHSKEIEFNDIMEILQTSWPDCFTRVWTNFNSNIRVQFRGSNWSAIGTMAKFIYSSDPTMVLDFSTFDSFTIKHDIVHQFGHALGLGHALMTQKDWSTLKKYVDIKEMVSSYAVGSEEDFEVEWTGKDLSGVNHDTSSVMQYTTNLSWLQTKAHCEHSSGINSLDVPKDVKELLHTFHEHTTFHRETLSERDKKIHGIFLRGYPKMEMKDLLTISTGTTVLTDAIQSNWKSIGMKLGVDMHNILINMPDFECLKIVLKSWLDGFYGQKNKYPPTWDGLKKLLKDTGQEEVCREFLDSVASSSIF